MAISAKSLFYSGSFPIQYCSYGEDLRLTPNRIFGGGYYLGSKTFSGDPINFLKDSPSPVVYVAPSYRLGYFGWLAGPSFTLSSGTTPNAGLYDQRFALQWVQKNIHLFHGQKDEVTVMGASSGAGSIMHHITAFGGEGESFFKRAVQMGPAYFLTGSHSVSENIFKEFEAAAGCLCPFHLLASEWFH